MTVKLIYPRRGVGDAIQEMAVEEARSEVEAAVANGYIPSYEGKKIEAADIREGMKVNLTPTGYGG